MVVSQSLGLLKYDLDEWAYGCFTVDNWALFWSWHVGEIAINIGLDIFDKRTNFIMSRPGPC